MQQKKLTPLENIQKQSERLRVKSSELAGSIENRTKYLQKHFAPLIRDSVVESAVSKMPAPLQSFAGKFTKKGQKSDTQDFQDLPDMEDLPDRHDSTVHKIIQGATVGITEIAPYLLKGKKGMLVSILLKQIVKRLRR